MRTTILSTILIFMISCQQKFKKTDFAGSRKKIEAALTDEDKVNLEKAIRVVALEAMRLKWEKPEEYEGQSFDDISLAMIDKLSYNGVVDLAEDILKDRNKKSIIRIQHEIDSLHVLKVDLVSIETKLDLFRISSLQINQVDFFDEAVPELEIMYQYIGTSKLKGAKTIQYELRQISTSQVIKSQIVSFGNDESILETDGIITEQMILSQTSETHPELWTARQYPINNPNLADFDLKLSVDVISLELNGEIVTRPKATVVTLDSLISNKNIHLDELKSSKGTLDELELVD